MCKWISGMRPAKRACTGNDKIDFWLTLFNIFPYKPALTIYGHIRSQFSDQEFTERKVTDGISEVLEYIFKINYLFVTFLEGKPNAFQNQIIDPCIKITSNDEYKNYEKLSELKKFLKTEFNNIISDESKRIKIDKFNINEYSYNGDKPLIKLLSVYKPIKNSETWDCHLNQIIYQHAKESLSSRKTLDHILHQSSVIFHPQDDPFEQETLYCFNRKKNLFEYNEKIITDELLDYFDVKTPISLDKEGYDEFKSKILDKAFNLRLMGDSANPQRGNRTIFNESEIREILDVQHIKFEMNLYNLAFKKFLGINEKISKNPSDAFKNFKRKADQAISVNFQKLKLNKQSNFYKYCEEIIQTASIEHILSHKLNNYEKINILFYDLGVISKSERKFLLDLVALRNSEEHENSEYLLTNDEIVYLKRITNKI